jgi:gamma-glutamyltranspeptidase / glutathione hydrolase
MKKHILALLAFTAATLPQIVQAQQFGVTSSADPRATEAGMEMLRKGGSANDAAMAMMLALTVVEPQSSGIGGGGFLIHSDATTGGLTTIDGRETAPAAATPERFVDETGKPLGFLKAMPGGRSAGVPGNIRLMALSHKKWGKLPWADLFQPAIKLAEEGYIINETMALRLKQVARLWADFPESQKIFWVDGQPATAGTRIKNPELAATLRTIAAGGPDAFYRGEIANKIVDAVTKTPVNAGDMTLSDLENYKAQERNAVCAPYRAYVICGMGPPSSGATTVLQILGALRPFDMTKLGKDNPQSWHLIAEAMQLAYADREKYLGDPAFVNVPTNGLIDPAYLAKRSKLINIGRAAKSYAAGDPPGAEPRTAAISGEVAGTSHFVAVDAKGSIASMTSTVEGIFGNQMVAGGFILNNELTDFTFAPEKEGAPVANRVQSGKRPLSSMSPTLVFNKDGRHVMALGSAGGKRIIMHVTKTLIGAIDFGLPLADAISLPNIYFSGDKSGGDKILVEEGTSLGAMKDKLAAFGQPVEATELASKVNGAQWTAKGWTGAADPRSEGSALVE